MNGELQKSVKEIGLELFSEIEKASGGPLSLQVFADRIIDWSMQDEDFKVNLFRFVDVLPSLKTSSAIIRHAQEYFKPFEKDLPRVLRACLEISPDSLVGKLAAQEVRRRIGSIASLFIVGENAKSSIRRLRRIRKNGYAFTIDILGEATLGEREAEQNKRAYINLLRVLGKESPKWSESRPLIEGHMGEISPVNISVKLSALYPHARPVATELSVAVLSERMLEIIDEAKKYNATVYFDMEDSSFTDIIIKTFKTVAERYPSYPYLGLVLQTYLRRTARDLEDLINWVNQRSIPIFLRIVKGAYWDTETLVAHQKHWPIPVWQIKKNSDVNYEKCAYKVLENSDLIRPAFGSHNLRSIAFTIGAAQKLGIPNTAFEFQVLYGMATPIKQVLAKKGYLVREYAPIGEMLPGMSYLVRRLLENTSNGGFLRMGFHAQKTPEELLQPPAFEQSDSGTDYLEQNKEGFTSISLRDFSEERLRKIFANGLHSGKEKLSSLPFHIDPIISGERKPVRNRFLRPLAEDDSISFASIGMTDGELIDNALEKLSNAWSSWKQTSLGKRADYLRTVAEELKIQRDRFQNSSVLKLENNGKKQMQR